MIGGQVGWPFGGPPPCPLVPMGAYYTMSPRRDTLASLDRDLDAYANPRTSAGVARLRLSAIVREDRERCPSYRWRKVANWPAMLVSGSSVEIACEEDHRQHYRWSQGVRGIRR